VHRSGFTLLEILVVVAIIVMLAGVGGYYVMGQYDQSKVKKAIIDAKGLALQVDTFKLKHDRLPSSLQELSVAVEDTPPLLPADKLLDPWGKQYEYEVLNDQGAERIAVFSMGSGKKISSLEVK
jgi:general secretion pathway protein G